MSAGLKLHFSLVFGVFVKLVPVVVMLLLAVLLREHGNAALEVDFHKVVSVVYFSNIIFRFGIDKSVLRHGYKNPITDSCCIYSSSLRFNVWPIFVVLILFASVNFFGSVVFFGLCVGMVSALSFIASRIYMAMGKWLASSLLEVLPSRMLIGCVFGVLLYEFSNFDETYYFFSVLLLAALLFFFMLKAGGSEAGEKIRWSYYLATVLDGFSTVFVPFLALYFGGNHYGSDVGMLMRYLGLLVLPLSIISSLFMARYKASLGTKSEKSVLSKMLCFSLPVSLLAFLSLYLLFWGLYYWGGSFSIANMRPEFWVLLFSYIVNLAFGPCGLFLVVKSGELVFRNLIYISVLVSVLLFLLFLLLFSVESSLLLAAAMYLLMKNVFSMVSIAR